MIHTVIKTLPTVLGGYTKLRGKRLRCYTVAPIFALTQCCKLRWNFSVNFIIGNNEQVFFLIRILVITLNYAHVNLDERSYV